METNKLLREEEVLAIIEENFAEKPVEDFDLVIPRAINGGGGC